MNREKNITANINDLESLIEHKILEFLGDPDSGLELREEFKENLRKRLKKSSYRISHLEVIKKYG